jgi:hypothetical protein
MKQLMENFNRFVVEEEELLNENPLALAAGAGALIALGSRGGRSLIAKILRIQGKLLDKLNKSLANALGGDSPKAKKMLDLVTELMPGRVAMDTLADLIEGLTDEEGDALNDALKPVKVVTPIGRIAKGVEMTS